VRKPCLALLLLVVFPACLSGQTHTGLTPTLHKEVVLSDYGKLPLSFEANNGQTDAQVKFVSKGHGYSLFLTSNEAVIELTKAAARPPKVRGPLARDLTEQQKHAAAAGRRLKTHANRALIGISALGARLKLVCRNGGRSCERRRAAQQQRKRDFSLRSK
jgi:hypothetical protein